MALATADLLAQFDLVGVREDLSDIVSEILLRDTNLLSRIGISGQATNVTHEWLESELNATTIVDVEALDAAGSTVDFDVTTGQGSRVRVGGLLKDTTRGKSEVLQVTAISTDNLTITRGYGSTSAEAHTSGSTWRIIGEPRQSGQAISDDQSTTRTRVSNFCQIFEKGIQIAGDSQAVLKAGIPDELAEQSRQRLMELMVQLDNSIINSIVSSSAGSDTVYRSMKGLREFLSASGGNTSSTAEEISPDVVNQMVQDIFDDGGNPNIIAVSQTQMRKISKFDSDKIRVVPGVGMTGRFVTQIMSDLGIVLDVVVDRWIDSDVAMVLDTTRLAAVPMTNRAFGINPLPPSGDNFRRQIVGDYTLECRNATKAHAIHTNLATS